MNNLDSIIDYAQNKENTMTEARDITMILFDGSNPPEIGRRVLLHFDGTYEVPRYDNLPELIVSQTFAFHDEWLIGRVTKTREDSNVGTIVTVDTVQAGVIDFCQYHKGEYGYVRDLDKEVT